MVKKIALLDVKQALLDPRFREKLPDDLKEEVGKFLNNINCSCNIPLYRRLLKYHRNLLAEFFPGAEIIDETAEMEKLSKNYWKVINCHISELEGELKKILPTGRVQLAVARYQDQITVVIDQLDVIW